MASLSRRRHVLLRIFLSDGLPQLLHVVGPGIFRHGDFLACARAGALDRRRARAAGYARPSAGLRVVGRGIGLRGNSRIHSPALSVLLLAAAGVLLFAARYYFWHHDIVQARDEPFYFFNGSDQLLLYGPRYAIPEFALLVFIFCSLAANFFSRRWGQVRWADFALPLQLYVIVCLAVILLPDGIRFPQQPSALALLTERLTSVSAALLCCLLGALQPRKWHLLACGAIAAIFFAFLYQDTGTINRMETQVEQLVRTLPRNSRVLATIKPPFPESRILVQHIADRACIGHCFSYGNYEPASAQFRVRVNPGNLYAMSSFDSTADMEDGSYEIQPEDLPAYQVYQCSPDEKQLCIRPLEAGEMNDRLGVHPDDE